MEINGQESGAQQSQGSFEAVIDEQNAENTASETESTQEQRPEQDDKFASKFAALSRKEKALRERESEIEARMAELEARLVPKEEEKKPELPLDVRLKKNPLQTLEELGLPYEKLTELVLNDGQLPLEMQMQLMKEEMDRKYQSEIEKLRSELTEKEKNKLKEQESRAVENYMAEISNFIESAKSEDGTAKYELIQANDASDLIFEVVQEYYNENGRILSNEEAADYVESYLEEEAEKLFKLNKLKSKFGTKPEEEVKQDIERQSRVTLSNALSSEGVQKNSERFLSDDESKSIAANLLKWND